MHQGQLKERFVREGPQDHERKLHAPFLLLLPFTPTGA